MRLLSFIAMLLFFGSCYSKQHKKWVFDFEGDLEQGEIRKFDSLFKSHENRTSNEIVLVTTSSYGNDENILKYSVNFGRRNGVGKKGKDNGIVIVFSRSKREVRISTGYGTEKVLRDDIAKKIIDSTIIPKVKQDSTFQGLWNGSLKIVSFLELPENRI